MNTCEVEACGRTASASVNGVRVCERCRVHFVSVGAGAVLFDGRYHGVIGSDYTHDHETVFPGLGKASKVGK